MPEFSKSETPLKGEAAPNAKGKTMSDKTLLVTTPEGNTWEVTKPMQIAEVYDTLLHTTELFEAAPQTREQWFDIQRVNNLHVEESTTVAYDYHEFGEGVSCDGEDPIGDLEESISALDAIETKLRFVLRKTYIDASGKIEASKRGTVAWFSWKSHWIQAKSVLREQRAALREIRAMRWRLVGELRSRTVETNPTVTRWSTSDQDGPSDCSATVTSGNWAEAAERDDT